MAEGNSLVNDFLLGHLSADELDCEDRQRVIAFVLRKLADIIDSCLTDPTKAGSKSLIMSARDISSELGISIDTVYRLAKKGDLPSHRLGKRRVFFRKELVNQLSASGSVGGSYGQQGPEQRRRQMAGRLAQ